MMFIVVPAAQVDRIPDPRGLLHAHHVEEETQALIEPRREQLDMREMGDIVAGFDAAQHESLPSRPPAFSTAATTPDCATPKRSSGGR